MTTATRAAGYFRIEVHNRGTRYIAHKFVSGEDQFLALVSGVSGNAGQWITLPVDETAVSWDYLAEKMPEIERWGGDAEGFVKLFAEAGIRVFNAPIENNDAER